MNIQDHGCWGPMDLSHNGPNYAEAVLFQHQYIRNFNVEKFGIIVARTFAAENLRGLIPVALFTNMV